MMARKTLLVVVFAILLFTGVAMGVTNVYIDRINPMEVSPTTSVNDPLVEMNYQQEIPSGTNNVELVTVYNNYDETQSVTFDLNNAPEMTFTDGTNVKTFNVNSNSSTTVYVDTSGPQKTCAETQDRQTQDLTYDSTSPTYTINTTSQTVDVCQPGGGNGRGNGPGGGGPPGQN